ncbi:MAG: HlyD family efflux transporter periplasmic adaptor subunit [Pseudomonadota bacterium]
MKSVAKYAKSVWVWLFGLLALAALSYAAFSVNLASGSKIQAELIEMPPSDYLITTRGMIDIEGGLVRLSAGATGVFRDVLVTEGQQVAAGQLLAVQDDRDEQIALGNAEIALENARIQLERARLDLEINKREAGRGGVQRAQDAISEERHQTQLDAVRRSELALETSRNDVARSDAAVETARFQLEQRELRAPVDGTVIKVDISPGSGVSAQNVSTAILIKPDRDKTIRVGVSEADADLVYLGQPVDVSRLSGGEGVYQGTVTNIAEVFSSVLQPPQGSTPNAQAATIEVIVNVGDIPFRLGQDVLVKFRRTEQAAEGL